MTKAELKAETNAAMRDGAQGAAGLPDGEDYVDFLIPAAEPDARAEVIGVNGTLIRVQPGEHVRVQRKYAEVWRNAQAQKRVAAETSRRAQALSRRALADL